MQVFFNTAAALSLPLPVVLEKTDGRGQYYVHYLLSASMYTHRNELMEHGFRVLRIHIVRVMECGEKLPKPLFSGIGSRHGISDPVDD